MPTAANRRTGEMLHEESPSQPLVAEPSWTPNQQAARRKIIEAAATLIDEEGLSACTFRAVAERSGLTKSTVHYYFDDANELVDLSVNEIMRRVARFASEQVAAAPSAEEAVEFLVRLFMSHASRLPNVEFRDSMLWPAYVAHAWKRGATGQIMSAINTLNAVFVQALERSNLPTDAVAERASSVHYYLLGAIVRNMIEPIDRAELARAASALSGLDIDPTHC